MRIGLLAHHAGVRASAIRYYETLGLLPPPLRVSGRRVYGTDAATRLRMIAVAKRAGFSLDEIATLMRLPGEGVRGVEHWRHAAARKVAEVDAALQTLMETRQALISARDCSCGGDIERCTQATQAASSPGARTGQPPVVPHRRRRHASA